MNPSILTLQLDTESFLFFNNLRKKYFPPERNFIDAHLSLFHQLPYEDDLIRQLGEIAGSQKVLTLEAEKVVKMGNAIGIKIQCDALMQLHKKLQQLWSDVLIPQDQHKLWPHIMIQNKVTPEVVLQTFPIISQDFVPFKFEGIGLSLFEYLGGPWKHIRDFSFTQQ